MILILSFYGLMILKAVKMDEQCLIYAIVRNNVPHIVFNNIQCIFRKK